MKIAVGNSRMDKKWKNRDISWEDLCQRVSFTIRTTETVEEYRKLKKGAQDNIKDVGGFVGGQLREGRRKNGMVLCRSMLTLDMDYGEPGIWDEIDLLHDFRCCVYSTHKHTPEHPRLRMIIPLARDITEEEYPEVPVKLKNNCLTRPLNMVTEMYSLPAYDGIDPNPLMFFWYIFFFGFMFGDAGQGLVLLIGGFLLYKFKKIDLAAIISCCGFFSTIFGCLFGSVFGFEDVIPALWLKPTEAMTDLPFVGRLNTVFVVAIALGMGVILFTMILNMITSFKNHDTEKTWFDTNGLAGFVFYFSLAATIVMFMSGHTLPAAAVLIIMFVLPLLVMFFKEPLTAVLEKKSEKISGGVGMFITQGFFELFEVLLSYFSNTLSFVRVGAFAVSHAAMMQVVLMLAGAESGTPSIPVIVLGNLFVCGMEGLIVGIQVLRLEYYELFSRFYKGSGREFKPFYEK